MVSDWRKFEQETLRIQARFDTELESLRLQGILTQTDMTKVKNQVTVSRNALLDTIRRNDLQNEIQEELFASLIKDYINSIQKIIDDALFKLGEDIFLKYKFRQVYEKANLYAKERNFSRNQTESLEYFSKGALAYALKMLPKQNKWSSNKAEYQKMINGFAEALQEFVESSQIVVPSISANMRNP
ncbi:MAG: hypothetical protein KC443_10580 [Anaerolineales bacterium]|nr:hypothetical protein [Anaerolineales bacterium]